MRAIVLALVAVVVSLALVAPALALSDAMCSAIGTGMGKLGGGDPPSVLNCTSSASNSPVVATPEPLGLLIVGLGLIGTRYLRRRH